MRGTCYLQSNTLIIVVCTYFLFWVWERLVRTVMFVLPFTSAADADEDCTSLALPCAFRFPPLPSIVFMPALVRGDLSGVSATGPAPAPAPATTCTPSSACVCVCDSALDGDSESQEQSFKEGRIAFNPSARASLTPRHHHHHHQPRRP